MSLWLRRRDSRTHLYIVTVINFLAIYVYIFLIFFLIFLLDFIIVTINLIQPLAAILIRINYLSIYLSISATFLVFFQWIGINRGGGLVNSVPRSRFCLVTYICNVCWGGALRDETKTAAGEITLWKALKKNWEMFSKDKKNALYLSVNVFSTKVLIGDYNLRLQLETGPPFYVVIRATRRSSGLHCTGSTFISQLF